MVIGRPINRNYSYRCRVILLIINNFSSNLYLWKQLIKYGFQRVLISKKQCSIIINNPRGILQIFVPHYEIMSSFLTRNNQSKKFESEKFALQFFFSLSTEYPNLHFLTILSRFC